MLRRILIVLAAAAITVLCLDGCKKRSGKNDSAAAKSPAATAPAPPEPQTPELKSVVEYKAELDGQITKDNMLQELEKMEKEVDREIN